MTRHGPTARRTGYTLLEMVLAAAVSVLLLGALFVALQTHLRLADTGRQAVEESTLARAVLARIANDIAGQLQPPEPTTTAATPGELDSLFGLVGAQPFNLGVQGEANRLMLHAGRLPRDRELAAGPASDLRRIAYWLTANGLARQEIRGITSNDLNNIPPDVPDEAAAIIAPEVRTLTFRYFDGSAWQDAWDGMAVVEPSNAPVGPPLAIEITIGLAPERRRPSPDQPAEPPLRTYRHVVAIPTANNLAAQSQGAP
jgi:type II secretory pathway component PulJ